MIEKIRKRDGRVIDFSQAKITRAIFLAASSVAKKLNDDVDYDEAEYLSDQVVKLLNELYKDQIPSVEDVQDLVVRVLIENEHINTSQAYILYRNERQIIRNRENKIVNGIKMLDNQQINHDYQQMIYQYGLLASRQYHLSGLNSHYLDLLLRNNLYLDDLTYYDKPFNYLTYLDVSEMLMMPDLCMSYECFADKVKKALAKTGKFLVIDGLTQYLKQSNQPFFNQQIINLCNHPQIYLLNDEPIAELKVIDSKYRDFVKDGFIGKISLCFDQFYSVDKGIKLIKDYLSQRFSLLDDGKLLVGISSDNKALINEVIAKLASDNYKFTNYLDEKFKHNLIEEHKINNFKYQDSEKITKQELIFGWEENHVK